MEIILADKAGFCFGVKRAIATAFSEASKRRVFCLGPIIHNPQEVERLRRAGVETVEDLSGLSPGDAVIIRSHGVPPYVLEEANRKGLSVIDLTCPFVAKAQRHARRLREEGYQVVVVGEKKHPEVKSILGYAGRDAVVIEMPEEALSLRLSARTGVVAQTTQSYSNFSQVVLNLLRLSSELKVYNTICNSTSERQQAARELAARADVMVVVGGRNSANTARLVSLCMSEGRPTHHIETADEIAASWFEGAKSVGVTAGASTPEWVIEAVLDRLRQIAEG